MTTAAEPASAPSPGIALRGLTKIYPRRGGDDLEIMRDLDLDTKGGTVVTIVGPSGCGKSTVLKLIAGLIPLSAGEVSFEPAEPRPRIGFVFQDYANALAPWRTVLRNVEFGLEIEGKVPASERTERAMRFIARVGLTGFEQSYPRELSGGMQQRVQLARVLSYEPSVLLMDEPFGSLDAQMRRILQVDLRRILGELRRTVVFVTHDIDEALYLGDRVVVLSRRPARILLDFEQPPRPDEYEDFLRSKDYPSLHSDVWETLRGELTDLHGS